MDERVAADTLRLLLTAADIACPRCGYNLRGSRGDFCPECGRPLTLAMFTTPPPPMTRAFRAAQGGIMTAAIMGLGHLAVYAPRYARLGEWGVVGVKAAAALAGVGATVLWFAMHRRILRWPRHKQARAATVIWSVVVLGLLAAVATM